jgi:hypothetical protein
MKKATLSEQAIEPCLESGFPAILSTSPSPIFFWTDAGAVEATQSGKSEIGTVLAPNFVRISFPEAYAFQENAGPFVLGDLANNLQTTPYSVRIEKSELNPYLTGILSELAAPNVEVHKSKLAHFIYGNFAHRTMQYRSEPVIHTGVVQLERADRCLRTLQAQLDRIGSWAQSGREGFESFDISTLDTCRELIRILSSYLVSNDVGNDTLFLVPSPDGTVFFKWVRKDKELSITVEQNLLHVQTWTPLSSYESEGYLEIALDQAREHFDWLTR